MRAVLDTNVVVSALIWGGLPLRILDAAVDGALDLVTSPALLGELRAVLARPHLATHLAGRHGDLWRAIDLYAQLAVVVRPAAVPRVVPGDADDDHVVAAAVAGIADLIVTGDRHLLGLAYHGTIAIVSPATAAERLAAGSR